MAGEFNRRELRGIPEGRKAFSRRKTDLPGGTASSQPIDLSKANKVNADTGQGDHGNPLLGQQRELPLAQPQLEKETPQTWAETTKFMQVFDGNQPQIPSEEQAKNAQTLVTFVDEQIEKSDSRAIFDHIVNIRGLQFQIDLPGEEQIEIGLERYTHTMGPYRYSAIHVRHVVKGEGMEVSSYLLSHEGKSVLRMDLPAPSKLAPPNETVDKSPEGFKRDLEKLDKEWNEELENAAREYKLRLNEQPISSDELNGLLALVNKAKVVYKPEIKIGESTTDPVENLTVTGAKPEKEIAESTPLKQRSINDVIASLTDSHGNQYVIRGEDAERKRTIGIFAYLRDQYGAQTVDDAQSVLRQRQVSAEVVRLWIDEGMTSHTFIAEALKDGYPEFAQTLDAENRRRLHVKLNEAGIGMVLGHDLPPEGKDPVDDVVEIFRRQQDEEI